MDYFVLREGSSIKKLKRPQDKSLIVTYLDNRKEAIFR
jgi:hypothetical protein